MKSKLYYELLDIIEEQDSMIKKQNKIIAELTNENLEKENIINMVLKEEEFIY